MLKTIIAQTHGFASRELAGLLAVLAVQFFHGLRVVLSVFVAVHCLPLYVVRFKRYWRQKPFGAVCPASKGDLCRSREIHALMLKPHKTLMSPLIRFEVLISAPVHIANIVLGRSREIKYAYL